MQNLCLLIHQDSVLRSYGVVASPIFIKKHKAFIAKLNLKFTEASLNWHAELDNSFGDIDKIEAQNSRVLILTNGLQKSFYTGDFPSDKIYQMGPLELTECDVSGVIRFLTKIVRNPNN